MSWLSDYARASRARSWEKHQAGNPNKGANPHGSTKTRSIKPKSIHLSGSSMKRSPASSSLSGVVVDAAKKAYKSVAKVAGSRITRAKNRRDEAVRDTRADSAAKKALGYSVAVGKPNIKAAISGKVNTAKSPTPMASAKTHAAIGGSAGKMAAASTAKQSVRPSSKQGASATPKARVNKHVVAPEKRQAPKASVARAQTKQAVKPRFTESTKSWAASEAARLKNDRLTGYSAYKK